MMKKVPLYKILSAVHIVFFTSILCFGLTFLSAGLLILPSFAAAFQIGRDWLYEDLDVTNSIVAEYFRNLRKSIRLLRFVPVSLLMLLNMAGIWAAGRMQIPAYAVICVAFLALLLTMVCYTAGYYVFVSEEFRLFDAAVAMFLKPLSVITIMIIMILCTWFFSGTLAAVLILMGTFFLFVIEVVIFVTMLYYLEITKQLDEEDKFAYLVTKKRKKCQK